MPFSNEAEQVPSSAGCGGCCRYCLEIREKKIRALELALEEERARHLRTQTILADLVKSSIAAMKPMM